MRLAGTARQYSKKAIPQLISTISHMARCSTFNWRYQAKVMSTFEATSMRIGASAGQLIGIEMLRRFGVEGASLAFKRRASEAECGHWAASDPPRHCPRQRGRRRGLIQRRPVES